MFITPRLSPVPSFGSLIDSLFAIDDFINIDVMGTISGLFEGLIEVAFFDLAPLRWLLLPIRWLIDALFDINLVFFQLPLLRDCRGVYGIVSLFVFLVLMIPLFQVLQKVRQCSEPTLVNTGFSHVSHLTSRVLASLPCCRTYWSFTRSSAGASRWSKSRGEAKIITGGSGAGTPRPGVVREPSAGPGSSWTKAGPIYATYWQWAWTQLFSSSPSLSHRV